MRKNLLVSAVSAAGLVVLSGIVMGTPQKEVLASVNYGGLLACRIPAAEERTISIKADARVKKTLCELELAKRTSQAKTPERYFTKSESYLLMKIAMAEAEGEDVEGKALVMWVVLNRVQDDAFPDSIEEVIFQKRQFSPVSNGRYEKVEPDEACLEAIRLITEEGWNESNGALYFESESASTWHKKNLQFLFQHGNHLFYTHREG